MRGKYRLRNIRLHVHKFKDWARMQHLQGVLEGGDVSRLGTDLSLKSRQTRKPNKF